MARLNIPLQAFNRGLVSPLALARTDIDRTKLSAEVMTNWIPKTQGAMIQRPGTVYLGSSKNDTGAVFLDFVASTEDTALLEMTPTTMRVWDTGDDLIVRPTRTTGIDDFNTDTGVWTKTDTNDGDIKFGDTGLVLDAKSRGGVAEATAKFALGDTGDTNNELAFDIYVSRGPVKFSCGNDTGDDSYIAETTLRTGYHNLAFNPSDTGGLHLSFSSDFIGDRIIQSISMADTGTLELTTPWGATDLRNIRWDQSADVMFLACDGYKQRRIERRGTGRSWSVVEHQSDNGPFTVSRTADVSIKANGYYGNTTLTSDLPFFDTTHVGSLFYLFTKGYEWEFRLAGNDEFTDPIVVTGIQAANQAADDRNYEYRVMDTGGHASNTWVGSLSLLHSTADKEDGPYNITNVQGNESPLAITDTGSFSKTNDDENALLSNITEYVKVGFLPGDYTSGACRVRFEKDASGGRGYDGGGDYSIFRVTKYNSPTNVDCEVLRTPTVTEFTKDWRQGEWSDDRKWPTDVKLYEGRLWWFGKSFAWGSVSDDFENMDDATVGDAAPLSRELGSGPIDDILFSASLGRLLLGTAGGVLSLRSTAFDEPLTATNMSAKLSTTHGAAKLPAVRIDNRALYVDRSTIRLYEIFYDLEQNDYSVRELTSLNPEVLRPGVISMAVQRQPDTRIHCVLSDGTVAILSYEPDQELMAWSKFETAGLVEYVQVLPGVIEDRVYYHTNRTINGVTKRFVEKWAREDKAVGDTGLTVIHDCSVSFTNDTGRDSSIGGFAHLVGEDIICWANDTGGEFDRGKDLSPDTGDGMARTKYYVNKASDTGDTGKIGISEEVKHLVGGLEYISNYRTSKLAYAAEAGTALTQVKRVDKIGFIVANTHNNAIYIGSDTGNLDPLPRVLDNGAAVDDNQIFGALDETAMVFPGEWDTDSRVHIKAKSGRPATVLAMVPTVQTNEKV